ncbi:hypothetical protein GCM10027414_05910 [Humibacter ginsengiterrae]
MSNARKFVLWVGGAVVAVAIVVVIVIVVARPGAWNGTLTSVAYSQSQAEPNFDDSTRTTTDADRLAALQRVLHDDGWHPGDARQASGNGCAGGVTTHLAMRLGDGSSAKLDTYQCGNSNDRLTADVTRLVSSWRAAD